METIRRATLDAFWSRESGTVRVKLTTMKKLRSMSKEELGLEDWLTPLGPYPFQYDFGMGLECTTLRLLSSKVMHAGNLKWESM